MPPLSNAQQPLRSRQVSPQFLSHMGQERTVPIHLTRKQQSTQHADCNIIHMKYNTVIKSIHISNLVCYSRKDM
ncbi:hypothetical protein EB796_004055 [Bugula neritina]|uniref:Uncharacterized protein n=1 Tax=Bugula neritina TaxID=10212 RepID=A0A7J7KG26_BUGNE|nr:hypothetical protein EB796_004055 [Bugula neritina]